ncbi:hypothetical protein ABZ686_02265 [Streptomyces sp. NPDC006992]|uniref:hypothetical protein n=1 Tax=Streptomyces sp. NPDC006992 TaxID=3155601 RepID=UPI0033C6E566
MSNSGKHIGDNITVHLGNADEKANEAVVDFLNAGWEFAGAAHQEWEASWLVPRWDRERLAQLSRAVEEAGTRVRVLRSDLARWVDNVNKGMRMVDQGIEEWSNPEIDTPSFFPTVAMPQLVRSLNGLQDHLDDTGERITDV